MSFKLGMKVDLSMANTLMLVSVDDFGLDARFQWVGRGQNLTLNYLDI